MGDFCAFFKVHLSWSYLGVVLESGAYVECIKNQD